MSPAPRDQAAPRSSDATRGGGERPRLAGRDAEVLRTAAVNGLVLLALVVGAWIGAPYLEDQGFWADAFGGADVRPILPLVGLLFLLGAAAPVLWPQTWEGELLARGVRALGWTAGLYWLVGYALEAPEVSALFVAPPLLSMPFAALGVARDTPRTTVRPALGVGVSTVALVALVVVLVLVGPGTVFWSLVIPVGAAYAGGAPSLFRSARRDLLPEQRATLDLPPETLHPASGTLGLVVTGVAVLFGIIIIAPGVPLSSPVAWVAFVLGIPAAARSIVRRHGIAHPRGLVGQPEMRIHQAVVHHLPDITLTRLDNAIDAFVRHGFGRRRLARALATLLEPTLPHATTPHLESLLKTLPRGPWARKRRANALAGLLGGQRILAEAEGRR